MDKELITINEEGKVDGRSLHEFLQIETPYTIWFPRMVEYGFVEGVDFNPNKNVRVQIEGNRQVRREVDTHDLTIDMAKELSMIQRTERGKQARLYFIECEKRLKSKPMSQVDILVESAKVLQEHERRMANLEMDIEEVKEGTKQTNERINTLNGVCTEGTKRQKLVALVNTYARKIGITYEKAWQEFKNAFNTAFHTNLGSRMKHFKEKHDIKKLTLPDYLEREGLLDDGLRIIDKMMGLQLMKI